MAENTNKEEIPADELICPITLELFRDPVRAKDGHVYERQAITRWILQHGTSPMTREPLQIKDLQPDEQLKSLARARRGSTVSYSSHNEQVTLPPVQRLGRYSHRVAPEGISIPRTMNCPFHKHCCGVLFLILLCVVVPVCVTIVSIVLARSLFQGKHFYRRQEFSQEKFSVKFRFINVSLSKNLPFNRNCSRDKHLNETHLFGKEFDLILARLTSSYSGTLTLNSSTFSRLYSPTIDRYYYDKIGIRISRSGVYEFSSESGIDMYGYLYLNPFNSTNVFLNMLTSDDNSGRSTEFYFRYSVRSDLDYVLIATTSFANVTGSYTIKIRGSSTVTFF